MKKTVLIFSCLFFTMTIFAQNEQKQGDDMAATGNYDGAAVMYRMCMDSNDQCRLKLFKLIFDEKIEQQFTDELFQLINPLAKKDITEAQYYLGMLHKKGIGGVAQDNDAAINWLKKSADKGFASAKIELDELLPKEEPAREEPAREEPPIEEVKVTPIPSSASPANNRVIPEANKVQGPSKLPGVLFAVGGVSIVAGVAATYFIPGKKEEDWSNSDNDKTYKEITKRNPVFLIAGAVVGGVCIGSGIVIKKKNASKGNSLASEPFVSPLPVQHDREVRLFFVAMDNGAGFRLTF